MDIEDIFIELVARNCHEVNKDYCELLGDTSQKCWKDAPQWQKDSSVNGVKFRMENPDSKPSDSHENWLKEKLADGWVYGPVKNVETKEHPCMVPYDQLPKTQQIKDSLFVDIVDMWLHSKDITLGLIENKINDGLQIEEIYRSLTTEVLHNFLSKFK